MIVEESKGIIAEANQDMVIVGAGMAGLVAAIEGTATRAKVTVLDKLGPAAGQDGIGNETSLSGGGSIAKFSLEASIEELLSRHVERGWGRLDSTLISTYLERLADDCKWLRDGLGLPYAGVQVKGRGPGLYSFLYEIARKRDVNTLFETKALKLLVDKVGRVTGVRARAGNRTIDFKAKALILATGGFEGNHEMLIKYAGLDITYGTVFTGCPTNTGDGHLMASEIGAQLINLSVCHMRTTDKTNGLDPSRRLPNIYPLGIYINEDCKRFVDEGVADSDTIGNAIVHQPGNRATLIFDENARAKYAEEYETYPRKEDVIKTANTIEELAIKIEVSPEKLKKLIEEFNDAVKDGKALGLTFPKTEKAYRIDSPPFYALHPVLSGLDHPLGGLKINVQAQVLDRENNPIPGLYAAGSLVNWSFGKPYTVAGVTGYTGTYHAAASSGLPTALVFGRIAGKRAAVEALESPG
jgi:succinate dehydrogenase/fumarate reductase flavoprotein subunit